MSPTQIQERIERIERLCAGLLAPHHRLYFVAMRNARARLLVKLRKANVAAGYGCTQNGALPKAGGAQEPSYRMEQLA